MTRRKAYLRACSRVERLEANIDRFNERYPLGSDGRYKTAKRLSYLLSIAWGQERRAAFAADEELA